MCIKSSFTRLTALLILGCVASLASVNAQQSAEASLTNASVVKLVRAGFKEKTVIAIIRSRPNRFELDPDRLIILKGSGVTENIILAMLAMDEAFTPLEDGWSDDSFFRRSGRQHENDAGKS